MADIERRLKLYRQQLSWRAAGVSSGWSSPSNHQCECGMVYVLRHEGIYKIGCTKNERSLVSRVRDAQRKYGCAFTLLHALASNCKMAAEAHFHGEFAKYRVIAKLGDYLGLELFLLPDEKVREILLIDSMDFDVIKDYGGIGVDHFANKR